MPLVLAAIKITVNISNVVNQIPPWAVGLTLDAGWFLRNNYNIRDPATVTVLKSLSPAILRVGGTEADWLSFKPDG